MSIDVKSNHPSGSLTYLDLGVAITLRVPYLLFNKSYNLPDNRIEARFQICPKTWSAQCSLQWLTFTHHDSRISSSWKLYMLSSTLLLSMFGILKTIESGIRWSIEKLCLILWKSSINLLPGPVLSTGRQVKAFPNRRHMRL